MREHSSYKAGKFVFFMIFIAMLLLMFQYFFLHSFFSHDNIISSKDSNLLLHSSLTRDLLSHCAVNFFGLPSLGKFFTDLVRKIFLQTRKAALIEQPTIDAISRNPFALF